MKWDVLLNGFSWHRYVSVWDILSNDLVKHITPQNILPIGMIFVRQVIVFDSIRLSICGWLIIMNTMRHVLSSGVVRLFNFINTMRMFSQWGFIRLLTYYPVRHFYTRVFLSCFQILTVFPQPTVYSQCYRAWGECRQLRKRQEPRQWHVAPPPAGESDLWPEPWLQQVWDW